MKTMRTVTMLVWGALLLAAAARPAAAEEIQILGFRFDPLLEGEPQVPEELRAAEGEPGFRLVQLSGSPTSAEVARLGAAVQVLQYYPKNTYLVWSDDASPSVGHVRWTGLVHPAYKVNDDVRGREGTIRNVEVLFYGGADPEETLTALAAAGGTVLRSHAAQPDGRLRSAIVELPADQVETVARLAAVLWLGYESPGPVLDDEMSSQIVAGNYTGGVPFLGYDSWLSGLSLSGAGVTWAVIDTGVDYDHPDLGSHIVGGTSYPGACDPVGQPGSDCPVGGHGTHVAGIVGGDATGAFTDGGGFFYGMGIAPSYGILASNSLSGTAWPPAGGWQEHSKRAVLGGAVGGNNSWTTGEGTAHGYQGSERTHDFMVRDGNFDTTAVAEPFIEVFSAGNSGPSSSTLTAPKEAKNLIVVAASQNYRVGSIDSVAYFSSRGPAVDGRWVPTVAAPGYQIASARNDLGGSCSTAISGTSDLYAYCSGTSMAAPQVSGAIVLLTEWWRGFNAGANPSPAMARALLVNTAVDMGTADIPNANEGWGRVHLGNLFSATPRGYRDQVPADVLDNVGEERVFTFVVADTGQPLRVSVAWSDAPGAVGANPALVNDLDLTVETGGGTYRGNVFSGGWSVTGGTADALNNIENVYVQSPGQSVRITVKATSLPGDGIPLSGDATDQDFALVCSNCTTGAAIGASPASVGFGGVSLGASASATITVTNEGTANLVISDAAVAGAGFSEVSDLCAGQALVPAATCAYQVRFTPASGGSHNGTVSFTSNAVNAAVLAVPLAGVGIAPSPSMSPAALSVGASAHGIWEPLETVTIAPSWRNSGTAGALGLTGAGVESGAFSLLVAAASYGDIAVGATGTCAVPGGCYAATATGPRPGLHWDVSLDETLSTGETHSWMLHVGSSFGDMPASDPFYPFVETLLHNGVTGGCGVTTYCPDGPTTRAQMAVFVLKAAEGPGYGPPACVAGSEMFADVPATSPFCPFVEELARRNVVAGCGGGNFCPDDPTTRGQMPVFSLRTLEGASYSPAACVAGSEVFADVPAGDPFCRWIEEYSRRGITAGCGGNLYCPTDGVTRGQMAVFQTKTFDLEVYGP